MKINNKGITLTELIISIALISIVILFLFRLLVDVRHVNNDTDFDRENQQTRAIILKTIQSEFLEKKLIGIKEVSASNQEITIEFTYLNGETAQLKVTETYIAYTNNSGVEKWLLEKENENTKIAVQCIDFYSSLQGASTDGEFFWIRINIPVIVNKNSKNTLDDFEFFYLGEKKDLKEANPFPTTNHLGQGHYNASTCG